MNKLCYGPVLLYEVQLNKGPGYVIPSMNCSKVSKGVF